MLSSGASLPPGHMKSSQQEIASIITSRHSDIHSHNHPNCRRDRRREMRFGRVAIDRQTNRQTVYLKWSALLFRGRPPNSSAVLHYSKTLPAGAVTAVFAGGGGAAVFLTPNTEARRTLPRCSISTGGVSFSASMYLCGAIRRHGSQVTEATSPSDGHRP